MIQGYPDRSSVLPGGTLTLHVSTDAPQFRVDFYRQGQTLVFIQSSGWQVGQKAAAGQTEQDWGWAGYTFPVPNDWTSGAYIAIFVEGDTNGNQISTPDASTADGRDSRALFVVRSAGSRIFPSILYKLSLFMYHAYNTTPFADLTGGSSLYTGASKTTMHRPGGGTGGEAFLVGKIDAYDPYNPGPPQTGSPRQTFAHWDVPFIRWLEKNGYQVDYCTDLDIHEDANLSLLRSYNLLLSVGHDEYWSEDMRAHIETFIRNGGNVAFFSGNTCWWRVNVVDNNTAITCDKSVHQGDSVAFDQWYRFNPENALTGVSYRNAGGWWDGEREAVGYIVQHTDHWVYDGTGLNDKDPLGRDQHLVGYECDGAVFADNQFPVVPTGTDGTPSNFLILGIGKLHGWQDMPTGKATATMGIYNSNGIVFTAATVDWARVLASGEPHVDQITRNVLNRLGGSPKGLATLSDLGGIVSIAGFFSSDDKYRHAIVATNDGNLYEIFYNPQLGQGQATLSNLNGINDIAAFFTIDDNYRHVVVATSDGNVHEIFYNPRSGQGQAVLGNFAGVVAVDGFFSPDDNYRHAIVATNDGNVHEIFYNPRSGQGQAVLGNFPGIVDTTAFFSPDDNYRHVIVATNDGNVHEIFYNPQTGQGQTLLGNFPGVTKVSAFYATNDAFFNRRVIVTTSDGRLHEIKYSPRAEIIRLRLLNTGSVTDIGSFFSSDDGFRHVVIAMPNGSVQELFYNP